MSDETAILILALATENAELRAALAEAQDLLVETAVDAGELHARIEELQAMLAEARAEWDAGRGQLYEAGAINTDLHCIPAHNLRRASIKTKLERVLAEQRSLLELRCQKLLPGEVYSKLRKGRAS